MNMEAIQLYWAMLDDSKCYMQKEFASKVHCFVKFLSDVKGRQVLQQHVQGITLGSTLE